LEKRICKAELKEGILPHSGPNPGDMLEWRIKGNLKFD
jgi:hypothetical protein